jgi:hypothetical protein
VLGGKAPRILDAGEWSVSRTGRLTPGERGLLNRRFCGQPGCGGERKEPPHLAGIRTRGSAHSQSFH